MDIATCTTPPRPLASSSGPAAGTHALTYVDWTALAAHAAPASGGYVVRFGARADEPVAPPAA